MWRSHRPQTNFRYKIVTVLREINRIIRNLMKMNKEHNNSISCHWCYFFNVQSLHLLLVSWVHRNSNAFSVCFVFNAKKTKLNT